MESNKITELTNYLIGLIGILFGLYSINKKTNIDANFKLFGLNRRQLFTFGYIGICAFLLLIVQMFL